MRKSKTKQSQSTRKGTNTGSVTSKQQSKKTIPSPKWYQNINELPLRNFIAVLCDKNIYALIISGHPELNDLYKSWDEINMQYADMIKDHEYRFYITTSNMLARLEIRYKKCIAIIEELKPRYVEQFARMLNIELSSSFKFDVRFPEDYDKDLKGARTRTGGMKIEIDLKRLMLEGLEKRFAEKRGPATKESFQSMLIALSDHVKYPIKDDITVFEYCTRVHRLNEYIESLAPKKLKRK